MSKDHIPAEQDFETNSFRGTKLSQALETGLSESGI
jgi:hypothetical protein